MKQRKKLKERNYKGELKNLTSDHEGITLIALVITIIVMLILVAVTIRIAVNGKLFEYAGKAVKETENAMKTENEIVDGKMTVDGTTYNSIDEAVEALKGGTQTGDGPQVTVNGETITLTPANVADYLGKKVTNYKGQKSVEIDGTTYNVSTVYRLYYVDFRNKYGDGAGTVYLRADCPNTDVYEIPITAPNEDDIVKIKDLNPGLYYKEDENGIPILGSTLTPPPDDYDNMKAVKWLTNTKNWEGLKPKTYSEGITENDINYIVGGPSLEMMIDSYNTLYKTNRKWTGY